MKVTITKIDAVATWSWEVPKDDVCGICRAEFEATCPRCVHPGDPCPLQGSTCGHNFHLHCIGHWLNTPSARGTCPMCRQPFQFAIGEVSTGQRPAP